jgi:hypothetical protein
MIRTRQIIYLLLACLFVIVVLVSMQFTNSITFVPFVLDLLSFTLLIIAVSSLTGRPVQSSQSRRRPSQQMDSPMKLPKR